MRSRRCRHCPPPTGALPFVIGLPEEKFLWLLALRVLAERLEQGEPTGEVDGLFEAA
jgi:hypothetical protein